MLSEVVNHDTYLLRQIAAARIKGPRACLEGSCRAVMVGKNIDEPPGGQIRCNEPICQKCRAQARDRGLPHGQSIVDDQTAPDRNRYAVCTLLPK